MARINFLMNFQNSYGWEMIYSFMKKFLYIISIILFSNNSLFANDFNISAPFVEVGSYIRDLEVSSNGKYLVTSSTGTLKLYDFETGKLIRTIQPGFNQREVKFSNDNKYLITTVSRGIMGIKETKETVKFWDLKTGEFLKSYMTDLKYDISELLISTNGKYIIIGNGYNLKCLNYKTGEVLWSIKKRNVSIGQQAISFSNNEKYIVVSSDFSGDKKLDYSTSSLIFIETSTGKIKKNIQIKMGNIKNIYLGKNNRYVLLVENSTVKLWDIHENREVWSMKGGYYYRTTTSKNNDYILIRDEKTNYKLIDFYSGKELKEYKNTNKVYAIPAPNEKQMFFYKKNVKLIDLLYGKTLKTFAENNIIGGYFEISSFNDKKSILFNSSTSPMFVWDTQSGRLINKFYTKKHHSVYSSSITPDGNYAIIGGFKKLEIIDLNKITNLWSDFNLTINDIAITKDNQYLITAGDKKLIKRDFITGKIIWSKVYHKTSKSKISILNEKYVILGTLSGFTIFNLKTGERIKRFGKFNSVYDMTVSEQNNSILFSGGLSGILNQWDLNNSVLIKEFGSHKSHIYSIDISSCGEYIISAGKDNVVKIWNVKTGKEINSFDINTEIISSIMFSYNNKYFITTGTDGVLNYWDTKSGNLILSSYGLIGNEWLSITPEGYFTGSKNGSKYLNILTSPMEVSGIDILYDHFFRPDLVKLKLQGKEKEYQKAIAGMTYKEALSNPPPQIAIASYKTNSSNKENNISKDTFEYETIKTDDDKLTLNFNIKEKDNGGIGLIRIYQEGKLIKTIGKGTINKQSANLDTVIAQNEIDSKMKLAQKDVDKTYALGVSDINLTTSQTIKSHKLSTISNDEGIYSIDVELKSGNNEISIEAFNKTNTVTSFRENINIKADIPKRKPKLYAVVVGINDFSNNSSANNLRYSVNDSKAIKGVLLKSKEKLYEEVDITYLSNNDVSNKTILKAFEDIKSKAKLEDTVVFYISTHGLTVNGNFYLLTNSRDPRNWIEFNDIFKYNSSIKALNQVFIVDACQSGGANDIASSVYDSRASVLAKQSGIHLLSATTKGTYAFESDDPNIKHGVFTNSILNTFNDKNSDTNKDGVVSILEVSKQLKYSQTHSKQTPVIRNIGSDVELVGVE
ncbi:MAG: caspase family protein [Campylobacterota bacterium]|nr:caspase family protein [Campylobacterota bacterium]